MKRYFMMLLFLTAASSFESCTDSRQQKDSQTAGKSAEYTCPMHPQIVRDRPGTCPICGMDLVLKTATAAKEEVMLSESQIQLAGIRILKVAGGVFRTSKALNGRLVADPTAAEVISARYPGRVEKLLVKEPGRYIAAGQPLFQIYSEQLQTLQLDYLLQRKQALSFPGQTIYTDLLKAARNKLLLFCYSPAQIRALEKANKVSPLLTVSSPSAGVVKEINVTEGGYVSEGTAVFRLENLNKLWLEADLYPSEADLVKVGTPLRVNVNGFQTTQNVKVDFVAPQLNTSTQILTVRASLNNPSGEYQPGMQASVFISSSKSSNGFRLPLDAVIRNSRGAHLWLKTGKNTFTARPVTVGAEDASQILISSGIAAGDEVVVRGAYLLYSEFVLKKGTEPGSAHIH